MSFNNTAVQVADKMNKPRPFVVGDPVIHKSTGLCGHVEAIEKISGIDNQLLTVSLYNGKRMRSIRREEFGLHTASSTQIASQRPAPARKEAPEVAAPSVRITGPISEASILDQLV
jgi:hypothetical protein